MTKLRAHNCSIVLCSKQTEEAFIDENHYQGFRPSEECYALKDENGQIVEMMTFCKPRYNKSYTWELLRLCTKKDYQVSGGASKLFTAFIENHPNESIISYCNESKFSGKIYEALGFKKVSTCSSYHYEKDGKSYHRSNFQRWKLEQLYPQYDRNKYTERQIMELEGYARVEETQATWVLGEPNDKWYIYEIECNGYHYIGQHKYHKTTKDTYSGSGRIIRRLTAKHPFTKTIIIEGVLLQDEADKYEKCMIYMSRLVYKEMNCNIQDSGRGYIPSTRMPNQGKKGTPHTEEFKKKISEIMKGHTLSENGKLNISIANSHPLSERHKQHISEGLQKSKKFKDAMKDKDRCEKISNSLKGHGNNHNRIKDELHKEGYLLVEDILKRDGISLSQFKRRKKKGLYVKKGQRGSISYY